MMNATQPETTETTENLRLERETCSRCGGSGHYSRCQAYGTRCFKCAGKGVTLTARGAAAAAFLRGLRSKAARELLPGDVIMVGSITFGGSPFSHWAKVEKIGPHENRCRSWIGDVEQPQRQDLLEIDWHSNKYGGGRILGAAPKTLYEVAQTAEQKVTTLRAAIEYQSTLTKTGKPRAKRGA